MKTLFALLVLVAACSKDNPYYCEQNPDRNCGIDGGTSGPDAPPKCTSAEDCSGTLPACDDGQGVCVACTATDIGACAGMKPVCESNSCRGCSMNSECASGACMPDGSCADAATVLYAQPTGGATTCTISDKCSIEQAFTLASSTQNIIALDPGMYSTSGTISTSKEITVLGREATIYKAGAGNVVLSVTSGGKLTVYYATITNGDDSTLGHGIACSGAKLTARFVTLQENDANGVNAVGCDVTVDRSTLWGNAAGGISLSGASQPFTLTNNFIYLNGSTIVAGFGGVKLSFTGTPTSQFEFNTIVSNVAKTGTGNSGGIACGATAVPITNSIIANNSLGTSTTDTSAQMYGDCTPTTSLVQNDLAGIEFVNTTNVPYNLKIGPTSTAKDAATTASTVMVDFEGDERPQNGEKDIGADEYK
jgi:hypothetical protein